MPPLDPFFFTHCLLLSAAIAFFCCLESLLIKYTFVNPVAILSVLLKPNQQTQSWNIIEIKILST